MRKKTGRLITISLAVVLIIRPTHVAQADFGEGWEDAKSYTSTAAKVITGGAAAALALAKVNLVLAQEALAAAEVSLAAAEGLAEIFSAQLQVSLLRIGVTTARLAVQRAAALVPRVAAVALAATVGTLAGQWQSAAFRWCWDPVCGAMATNVIGDEPIYVPATDEEIDALVPELIFIGTGLEMTKADFQEVGDMGLASWDFMAQGTHLFIGAARGAAASTAHRDDEVLTAAADLKTELVAYAVTIAKFADVLAVARLPSPVAELQAAREDFDTAINEAKELIFLKPDEPGFDEILALLDSATLDFQTAQEALEDVTFGPLVGPGGFLPDVTLEDFHKFLEDCAANGVTCLPQEEVDMANRVVRAAGVSFPTSFVTFIAEWDGEGDIEGIESAWFGPTGVLDPAEFLSRSVKKAVETNGPWLNINLETGSPLLREARATTPSVITVLAFAALIALAVLLVVLARRRARCRDATSE